MSESTNNAIGKLVPETQGRDAIHIAVAPVIAAERLTAGRHIGFVQEANDQLVGRCEKPIGIVDPFYPGVIQPGERFLMFLYPNTITGLRHEWTHPAFTEKHVEKVTEALLGTKKSEEWLRKFAGEWHLDYDEMIEAATSEHGDFGNYVVANGRDLHSPDELGDDLELFWQNIENLTGRTFSEEHKEKLGWSCSC